MGSTFSTRSFTYDKKDKKFVAEASTIKLKFKQIYPDSCDEGIELVSYRTGNVSEWIVVNNNYDSGHELVSWGLKPTAKSLKQFPGLKGHTMVIFND